MLSCCCCCFCSLLLSSFTVQLTIRYFTHCSHSPVRVCAHNSSTQLFLSFSLVEFSSRRKCHTPRACVPYWSSWNRDALSFHIYLLLICWFVCRWFKMRVNCVWCTTASHLYKSFALYRLRVLASLLDERMQSTRNDVVNVVFVSCHKHIVSSLSHTFTRSLFRIFCFVRSFAATAPLLLKYSCCHLCVVG